MDNSTSQQVPSSNSVEHVPSSQLPSEVKSEVAVKAFRSQRGLLLNLMRHCLPSLANSLLARDIIPKDVFEDVCNQMVNKSQRCADLLECMEDTIEAFPSKFIDIIRVLELESFLKSIASEIVLYYSRNSSVSVDSCPLPVSSAISHYRAYLKAVYSNSSVSQDSKWPPTPSREYIKLAVVEGRHKVREDYIGHTLQGNIKEVLKKRREISLNEILPINLPKSDSKYVCYEYDWTRNSNIIEVEIDTYERLILIEGAPGIGKSTFTWELCRKWEEFPSMQQYSLVILLRLREAEVQEIRSVSDLFCSYESKDKKLLEDEVLERQGKGVLFILDGFDELPSDFQSKGYLRDLIRDSALPESTVLVTSRPSATAKLLTSCRPDKHIEILGFTQESVEAYAYSVFKSQPDQFERFKTFISASNNPAINSLMYVPLNAAIIVQIFCNAESDSFLPHTLTQLYIQLCITILNRHFKANCPSIRVDAFKDLPSRIHNQFLKLSKLAFEGMKKEEVIFHSLPPDFLHFGFLDAVSALYGGGGVSCNFLHLTVQEFLAAYYISSFGSEGLNVFTNSQYSNKRWNLVLRFLAGITGHFKCIIEKHGEEDNHGATLSFFIQCLFEAQNHKKQSTLLHLPHSLHFELTSMSSPLDVYALGYCITNSIAGKTKRVKISSFTKSLQPFIQGLNTHTLCSSYLELRVVDDWESLTDLSGFFPILTSLHYAHCELTCEYMLYLSEVTPQMKFLTELEIHCSEPLPCLDGIVKILNTNKILKRMFVSSFWLRKDIRTVTEALEANSTLQFLKIGVSN